MKHLHETMKQLLKASQSLSKLNLDHQQPWHALSQMNQILDSHFWENLVHFSQQATPASEGQKSEIVPTVKKSKKKRKEKPAAGRAGKKSFHPRTDIFETEEQVIVCCEVPGFVRDSLEVTLTDQRTLELSGKIKEHDQGRSQIHAERSYGGFYRKFELPLDVSSKGMKVQYQDGLLELYLVRDDSFLERKTTFRANV